MSYIYLSNPDKLFSLLNNLFLKVLNKSTYLVTQSFHIDIMFLYNNNILIRKGLCREPANYVAHHHVHMHLSAQNGIFPLQNTRYNWINHKLYSASQRVCNVLPTKKHFTSSPISNPGNPKILYYLQMFTNYYLYLDRWWPDSVITSDDVL